MPVSPAVYAALEAAADPNEPGSNPESAINLLMYNLSIDDQPEVAATLSFLEQWVSELYTTGDFWHQYLAAAEVSLQEVCNIVNDAEPSTLQALLQASFEQVASDLLTLFIDPSELLAPVPDVSPGVILRLESAIRGWYALCGMIPPGA
jgi:hypothetical protein